MVSRYHKYSQYVALEKYKYMTHAAVPFGRGYVGSASFFSFRSFVQRAPLTNHLTSTQWSSKGHLLSIDGIGGSMKSERAG